LLVSLLLLVVFPCNSEQLLPCDDCPVPIFKDAAGPMRARFERFSPSEVRTLRGDRAINLADAVGIKQADVDLVDAVIEPSSE
jgi:hypothetical protein